MALLHVEIRVPTTIPTCSVFPPRFAPKKHLPHNVKSLSFQMRLPCRCSPLPELGTHNCAKLSTGRRTGRSLPVASRKRMSAGGGKSELRRAVCRITSGMWASRPADGQCHRKDTASATPLAILRNRARASLEPQYPSWPACRVRSPLRQLQRRGKGEKVR